MHVRIYDEGAGTLRLKVTPETEMDRAVLAILEERGALAETDEGLRLLTVERELETPSDPNELFDEVVEVTTD